MGCWCGQIPPSARAEVAEIDFTAFTRLASERTPGRLVVRRIPDLNPRSTDGQGTMFDTWRVLAVMAFNLTRAAATSPARGRPQQRPPPSAGP